MNSGSNERWVKIPDLETGTGSSKAGGVSREPQAGRNQETTGNSLSQGQRLVVLLGQSQGKGWSQVRSILEKSAAESA